ncbi:receptor-like protein eix2 [Quercus suber]|uniref:Receptor-like protein eix2 n=1 Tax=Quercus suber TaxID=58331 RepID=A0AAW0INE4_QUESU
MSSIEDLDLSFTNLNGANDWLEVVSSLPNLKTLDMSACNLSLMSLSSFSQFSHSKSFTPLESLQLRNNEINDIPKFFGDICTLRELDLSGNNLNGQLIEHINDLFGCAKDSLEVFVLASNQLWGSLPDFALFPSLKEIYLLSNKLNGTMPKTIGNLHNLEHLNVSLNYLQDVISEAHFSNLSKLLSLDLSGNSLTLEFDFNWVPPFQLEELRLRSCKLGPRFPNWIRTQWNVTTLDISNAEISDTVPAECYLRFMDLGNNRFSEKIPPWIAEDLPQLIVLILRSNKFSGSIPWETCKLKYLRILDLSLNDFSGIIPQCLNNLTAMAYKAYSSTNLFEGGCMGSHGLNYMYIGDYVDSAMVALKGREYKFGKNLGLLKIINLSSNKLTGKLPTEITSLLELVVLNVSKNNLIGKIPQTIGQLKQLESFDMSRNRFLGEIPSSMSELQFLSRLDLSFNNLSGKIPSGTQLQGFDATCFTGNRALYGPPLTQKCPGEETPNQSLSTDNGSTEDDEDNRDEFKKWFYVGAGIGFAVGFWGICSSLILKRSWRHAYFLLLDNMKDWLYVAMAVNKEVAEIATEGDTFNLDAAHVYMSVRTRL